MDLLWIINPQIQLHTHRHNTSLLYTLHKAAWLKEHESISAVHRDKDLERTDDDDESDDQLF